MSHPPAGQLPVLDAGLPAPARGLFTTRAGGVSETPFEGLNLALHVQDRGSAVLANRDLLAAELGVPAVHWAEQVHGAGVLVIDRARAGRRQLVHAGAQAVDALVTDVPGVALGVLAADCLPVLFADAGAGVVGAAHAGRQGLVVGVLEHVVARMVGLGASPASMVASVGPAVGGCCYEVPEQMRDDVESLVPGSATITRWGTPSLDLPAGALGLLERLGISTVLGPGPCTHDDDRFFSYRRDHRTGRHAGVVMLQG